MPAHPSAPNEAHDQDRDDAEDDPERQQQEHPVGWPHLAVGDCQVDDARRVVGRTRDRAGPHGVTGVRRIAVDDTTTRLPGGPCQAAVEATRVAVVRRDRDALVRSEAIAVADDYHVSLSGDVRYAARVGLGRLRTSGPAAAT